MADSLHEQLTATKRAHILNAAGQVFAEKGFHATTVRDVARRAGVADGTIYNYFENKHALLLGLFDELTRTVRGNVDPAGLAELDLRGFLRVSFSHPLQAFQASQFELFRVILSEVMVDRELGERFQAQILAPMIEGGEGFARMWAARHGVTLARGGLNMRVVCGLVIGLLVQRALGDETLVAAWDDLPGALADLLLGGLVPDEA